MLQLQGDTLTDSQLCRVKWRRVSKLACSIKTNEMRNKNTKWYTTWVEHEKQCGVERVNVELVDDLEARIDWRAIKCDKRGRTHRTIACKTKKRTKIWRMTGSTCFITPDAESPDLVWANECSSRRDVMKFMTWWQHEQWYWEQADGDD
jgi:hypothetical protein